MPNQFSEVTDAELRDAESQIRAAGYTLETVGRIQLARILGPGMDRRAQTILSKLRPKEKKQASPILERKLQIESQQLKKRLRDTLSTQVLNQKYQDFIAEVAEAPRHTPEWVHVPKSGRPKQGMPVLHLSDAHFDEVVDPKQVNWLNCYNRKIATARLRRFFEKSITLCDEYLKGVNYPGVVLAVSGDMFSGQIHEELKETNEDALCGSFAYWIDPMYAGIRMLAERFGRVHVVSVTGNHPRLSIKPRAKGGVRDYFDWLLATMLQRDFRRDGDARVSFTVSEAFDLSFRIYQTRYLQTHGDQFKGGSGIAAELSPMMIGDARKRERQQAANDPYDVMIAGHWHRRINMERFKMNGTLKGVDEYAFRSNFKYQRPQQSLWIDTPEHGITIEAPVFVKAENEGWERTRTADARAVFEVAA